MGKWIFVLMPLCCPRSHCILAGWHAISSTQLGKSSGETSQAGFGAALLSNSSNVVHGTSQTITGYIFFLCCISLQPNTVCVFSRMSVAPRASSNFSN